MQRIRSWIESTWKLHAYEIEARGGGGNTSLGEQVLGGQVHVAMLLLNTHVAALLQSLHVRNYSAYILLLPPRQASVWAAIARAG